jgi:hypothetical protein
LENLYAATEDGKKDSAKTNYHVFSETGEISASSSSSSSSDTFRSSDKFLQELIYGRRPNMACCILFRLSRLKENGIYFPRQRVVHEDLAFTPLAFKVMNDIGFTTSHDYLWIETPGSLSRSLTEQHVDSIIFLIRELYEGDKRDLYTVQEKTLRKAFYWRHLIFKTTRYSADPELGDYVFRKLMADPLLHFSVSEVEALGNSEKQVFLSSVAIHFNSDFVKLRQRLYGPYLNVGDKQAMTFAYLVSRLASKFVFRRFAQAFRPNVTFAFLTYSVLRRIKSKIFGKRS